MLLLVFLQWAEVRDYCSASWVHCKDIAISAPQRVPAYSAVCCVSGPLGGTSLKKKTPNPQKLKTPINNLTPKSQNVPQPF